MVATLGGCAPSYTPSSFAAVATLLLLAVVLQTGATHPAQQKLQHSPQRCPGEPRWLSWLDDPCTPAKHTSRHRHQNHTSSEVRHLRALWRMVNNTIFQMHALAKNEQCKTFPINAAHKNKPCRTFSFNAAHKPLQTANFHRQLITIHKQLNRFTREFYKIAVTNISSDMPDTASVREELQKISQRMRDLSCESVDMLLVSSAAVPLNVNRRPRKCPSRTMDYTGVCTRLHCFKQNLVEWLEKVRDRMPVIKQLLREEIAKAKRRQSAASSPRSSTRRNSRFKTGRSRQHSHRKPRRNGKT